MMGFFCDACNYTFPFLFFPFFWRGGGGGGEDQSGSKSVLI